MSSEDSESESESDSSESEDSDSSESTDDDSSSTESEDDSTSSSKDTSDDDDDDDDDESDSEDDDESDSDDDESDSDDDDDESDNDDDSSSDDDDDDDDDDSTSDDDDDDESDSDDSSSEDDDSTSDDDDSSSDDDNSTSDEDDDTDDGIEKCGIANVLDEDTFEALFPKRNPFYTYEDLIDISDTFADFGNTGDVDTCKREVAAFLANVARETGQLVYIEQISKGPYCSDRADCRCESGKQYFGRGPIQLSWNYNYCAAGKVLGLDLRADPDHVARDPWVAWMTGLWFWMTQSGAGRMTPHEAMTNGSGFGETIRSINGGQECNGGWPEAVNQRVDFYRRYCEAFGVDPGANLTC